MFWCTEKVRNEEFWSIRMKLSKEIEVVCNWSSIIGEMTTAHDKGILKRDNERPDAVKLVKI